MPAQASPATRFAVIIDALCTVVVTGLGAGLPGPLVIRLWERLTKLSVRFTALGKRPITPRATLNDQPLREPQPAGYQRTEPPLDPRYKTLCLPKAEAWLLRLLPETEPFAAQLQAMLAQPDMQALLQAKPSLIRLIRPLCRMLGVQPPIIPPPSVQPPPVPPDQVQTDRLQSARGRSDQVQPPPVQPPPVQPPPVQPNRVQPDQVPPNQVESDRVNPDQVPPTPIQPDADPREPVMAGEGPPSTPSTPESHLTPNQQATTPPAVSPPANPESQPA